VNLMRVFFECQLRITMKIGYYTWLESTRIIFFWAFSQSEMTAILQTIVFPVVAIFMGFPGIMAVKRMFFGIHAEWLGTFDPDIPLTRLSSP